MPSLSLAALCIATGLVLWMASGYALARSLAFDRAVALALAPVLGWAVQNALALMLSLVVVFSPVATVGAVALICAAGLLRVRRGGSGSDHSIPPLTLWVCLAAAVMAAGTAASWLPEFYCERISVATGILISKG